MEKGNKITIKYPVYFSLLMFFIMGTNAIRVFSKNPGPLFPLSVILGIACLILGIIYLTSPYLVLTQENFTVAKGLGKKTVGITQITGIDIQEKLILVKTQAETVKINFKFISSANEEEVKGYFRKLNEARRQARKDAEMNIEGR